MIRQGTLLLAVGLAVLSAGCSAADTEFNSPMMGAMATSAAPGWTVTEVPMSGAGHPMMGVQPGYNYSRLDCSAPNSLPGAIVTVMLGDMGMTRLMSGIAPLGTQMMLRATPVSISADQISLVVSNMGWRTHELVVLPLAVGAAAGARVPGSDGKVDETGSLGEVSNSCGEGTGDGIVSGTVGWTTVTLPPGRYELVCNLQNHYANGMYQTLVVT